MSEEQEIVEKAWSGEIRQRIESLVTGTASTTLGNQARAEIRAARVTAQQNPETGRQTMHTGADAAWLDELRRRADGYFDGSVKIYSREEVDADVLAALASSRLLDSTNPNTPARRQRIAKLEAEIQTTSPDLMKSYQQETAEWEAAELADAARSTQTK